MTIAQKLVEITLHRAFGFYDAGRFGVLEFEPGKLARLLKELEPMKRRILSPNRRVANSRVYGPHVELGPVLALIAAKNDPDCPPMLAVALSKMVRRESPLWHLRMQRRKLKRSDQKR